MLHFQVGLDHEQRNDLHQRVLISSIVHMVIIMGACLYGTRSNSRIHITDSSDDYVVVMPLYKTITQPQSKPSPQTVSKKSGKPAPQSKTKIQEQHSSSKRKLIEKHESSARFKPKVVETKSPKSKTVQVEAEQLFSKRKRVILSAGQTEQKMEKSVEQEEPTTIYLGRDDLAAYERGQAIKKALLQQWHAPHFLDISGCELLITLDKQGKAQIIKIIKSSGVPAYDTAARMAIMKTNFPSQVWGKEFTLVFGA